MVGALSNPRRRHSLEYSQSQGSHYSSCRLSSIFVVSAGRWLKKQMVRRCFPVTTHQSFRSRQYVIPQKLSFGYLMLDLMEDTDAILHLAEFFSDQLLLE